MVEAVEGGSVDDEADEDDSDGSDPDDGAVAAAAVVGEVETDAGGERRGEASSAERSSIGCMLTSVSPRPSTRLRSGPWRLARFTEEEADDAGEESGAGPRACDAMLQSIAEADEDATEGRADEEEEVEEGADAGAVGAPGAPSRRGM